MVDKVKALNWNLYSKIFVVFANICVIYSIIQMALNTKELDNTFIIVFYLIIGAMTHFLMKLSNAAIKELEQ